MRSERQRPTTDRRRPQRRARALRWTLSLLALAGAGFTASAQASSYSTGVAAVTESVGCATGVQVDFDLQLDARLGAYAVAGVVVSGVPAGCAGSTVRVVVLGADGEPLASEAVALAEGAAAPFDGAPVDARDVTSLVVLPG